MLNRAAFHPGYGRRRSIAARVVLPRPLSVTRPRQRSDSGTLAGWVCEAAIFILFVAALTLACAIDGVNCFGDWSDE